jgi:hypothetical protein
VIHGHRHASLGQHNVFTAAAAFALPSVYQAAQHPASFLAHSKLPSVEQAAQR